MVGGVRASGGGDGTLTIDLMIHRAVQIWNFMNNTYAIPEQDLARFNCLHRWAILQGRTS